MPGRFWDTSAFVKHYHPELGTPKVDALLQYKEAEWLLRAYGPQAGQGVRTLDALQLAVALDLRNKSVIDTLVSSDARLLAVALTEGFPVINPEQP